MTEIKRIIICMIILISLSSGGVHAASDDTYILNGDISLFAGQTSDDAYQISPLSGISSGVSTDLSYVQHSGAAASTAAPTCGVDNLSLCTTQAMCEAINRYWYDDSCNQAAQSLGNKTALPSPIKIPSFKINSGVKSSGVNINSCNGDSRNPILISNSKVKLSFDDVEADFIAISHNSSFSNGIWMPLTRNFSWDIGNKEGLNKIYIKFKTREGGESEVCTLYFSLDKKKTEEKDKNQGSGVVNNKRNGQLVKYANGPKVYLIENGLKRHIFSEKAFTDNGFKWTSILVISDSEKFENGEDILEKGSKNTEFIFTKFLKIGSKGDEVRRLQVRLRQLGYFNFDSNTGYFGLVTAEAVKKLQQANNIEAVGYVGPGTRNVLNKGSKTVVREEVVDSVKFTFSKFLKIGSKGDEVRKLQARLRQLGYFNYESNTGYFGLVTAEAVKKLQSENNLEVVGYVGPGTRSVLNKR